MKWKILLLILAVTAVSSRAFGEEVLTFAQFMPGDGNLFENRITMEELQKMPSWKADEDPIPTTPDKALKIAREHLRQKNKEFVASVVSEIKLEQFVAPKYVKDKWYYMITFMKAPPEGCGIPETLTVSVMMNGTINEPILAKFDPQLKFR